MSESLLLHFDGTDGATTTVDSSPTPKTVTLWNGPHLEIDQKKFPPTSLRTERSPFNRYAKVDAHVDFDFGSGDFGIDLWVRQDDNSVGQTYIRRYAAAINAWWLWYDVGMGVTFQVVSGGSINVDLSNAIDGKLNDDEWTHIAVARSGDDWYLSVGGVQIATVNSATAFPVLTTYDIEIATEYQDGTYEFGGYLDEIRILKGEPGLIGPFDVPSSPWPYPYKATQQLSQLFGINITKQLNQLSSLNVANQLSQPIHSSITNQLSQIFSLNKRVANQTSKLFDLLLRNPVANQLSQPSSLRVANQLSQPSSLRGSVANQVSQLFALAIRVANQVSQPNELLVRNPVANQASQRFDLISAPTINITDQPYILFNGEQIEIGPASIASGENSFIWDAEIEIKKVADYSIFKQDDEIELNLLGENYKLVVISKSMNQVGGAIKTGNSISMTLTASSPAIQHAFPRAIGITKTWDTATLAKDIAEEVTGEVIDWQLVDWYIPAGKLSVTNAAPISIVQQLAEAAGGIVESKRDGSLLVRHAFPVSVKDWDTAVVDQTYSDIADNLAVSEMYNFIDRYNKVLISDGFDESKSDAIEYVKDEANSLSGVIKVYPNPYRSVDLYHTSLDHIGLTPQGEIIRTEVSEFVEFKNNKASLNYPVYGITSVVWKYDDLGAVSFTSDKQDISTADDTGYSLALITYQTRSYNFNVSSSIGEAVQFIIRGS